MRRGAELYCGIEKGRRRAVALQERDRNEKISFVVVMS